MPEFTFAESFKSREGSSGSNPTTDLIYDAYGSNNDIALKAEAASNAPSSYDGLNQINVLTEQLGDEHWRATVVYGINQATGVSVFLRTPGDSLESFDTTGDTIHITHAKQTIHGESQPGNAVSDFDGAIGVTDEGVDGVDIVQGQYRFTVTRMFTDSEMSNAYKATIRALTGMTNNAVFKGMDIGEVLFRGARGSRRGDGNWEISFEFGWNRNETNIDIGSGITVPTKGGWEYLWVRYATDVDNNAFTMIKKPFEAFVSRVYDAGNFGALGIGV